MRNRDYALLLYERRCWVIVIVIVLESYKRTVRLHFYFILFYFFGDELLRLAKRVPYLRPRARLPAAMRCDAMQCAVPALYPWPTRRAHLIRPVRGNIDDSSTLLKSLSRTHHQREGSLL